MDSVFFLGLRVGCLNEVYGCKVAFMLVCVRAHASIHQSMRALDLK